MPKFPEGYPEMAEHTLDLPLPNERTVRLWLDANVWQPQMAFELGALLMGEDRLCKSSQAEALDFLANDHMPGLNAAQVIDTSCGFRIGSMIYCVPFERKA